MAESIHNMPCEGLPEPDYLYEIVNGELVEVTPAYTSGSMYASFLAAKLNQRFSTNRAGLAIVDVLLRFKPDRHALRPDVAYLNSERLSSIRDCDKNVRALDLAPNIAVEVVRPSTLAAELESRIWEYLQAGVELVWVIYPISRRIYVSDSAMHVRVLNEMDDLEGGSVIPDLKIPVRSLFELALTL